MNERYVDYIPQFDDDVNHDCKEQHVDMYQDYVPSQVSRYKPSKYSVKARRNDDEKWTDWSETNDYDKAMKMKNDIELCGWQCKLIVRGD